MRRVRFLAHEGGGVRGIAHVPVLEALERADRLHRIESVAGTSAGALLALLVALRADTGYIKAVLQGTDWNSWAPQKWRIVTGAIRLLTRRGIFSNKVPRRWIEERLDDFAIHPSVTFEELAEARGCELQVTATNMDRRKPELFSPSTTPRVSVVAAVLASMSIPMFYPPVEIRGDLYLDGGISWNHPVDVFEDRDPEEVLAVRVDTRAEIDQDHPPVKGPLDLAARSFAVAMNQANKSHVPDHLWPRVVRIRSDFPSTRFDLSDRDVYDLLQAGERAVEEFLGQQKAPSAEGAQVALSVD